MKSVFISHSSADRTVASRLHAAFVRVGVRAWLDDREIAVGDNIPQAIERGISEADYLGLVLTPRSVASRWVLEELSAFQMDQFSGGQRKVLPLLFEDCALPPLLRAKKYADFRRSFDDGFRDTLHAIGVEKLPPVPQFCHSALIGSLSLVWGLSGRYRGVPWSQLKREAEETCGGLQILTEDLLEMAEYKPAPFREHAWVLRDTLRDLLSDALPSDAMFLSRIVVAAWKDHHDNIGAGWPLVLMPRTVAAAVLSQAYALFPATTKWLMSTLYDFAVDSEGERFEADMIKDAGSLPDELVHITRENRFHA